MNALTDQSPMPFGAHKGKKMENVPASYLLWLWEECEVWNQPHRDIHQYIADSLSALMKECPNYIVTHTPKKK